MKIVSVYSFVLSLKSFQKAIKCRKGNNNPTLGGNKVKSLVQIIIAAYVLSLCTSKW